MTSYASILLALLLTAVPAAAQTIQVSGGSSTMFGSSGGGLTFYAPNSTLYAGAGLEAGKIVYGFSDTFRRDDVDFTLGDRQLGFNFDGAGLALVERGAAAQWQSNTATVAGFVGATSFGYFAPYLQTAGASAFGAGFYYRQKLGRFELNSLQVVQGWEFTSLGGLGYTDRHFAFTAAGGLLQSHGYIVGTGLWHDGPLILTANHQELTIGERSSSTSLGEGWAFSHFNVQGQLFFGTALGRSIDGQTLGAGARVGPVALQSSWFHSNGQTFITNTATEHFWRLQLSQSLTGKDASFGGGFQSNRLSLNLSHQIVFVPGLGFRQANLVQFTVQIHDTSISAGTVMDPFGNVRWTTYQSTYLQTGIPIAGGSSVGRIGGIVVEGYVRDRAGAGVEGIAVRIGKLTAYSSASGYFSFNLRHATKHPISVDLPASVAAGTWAVVSIDGSQITVERL